MNLLSVVPSVSESVNTSGWIATPTFTRLGSSLSLGENLDISGTIVTCHGNLSTSEYLNLGQTQIIVLEFNADLGSFLSTTVNRVNINSFPVADSATELLLARLRNHINMSTVDPSMTTVSTVVDKNQIDRVLQLEIDLPPHISVSLGVGHTPSVVVTVNVTVHGSGSRALPACVGLSGWLAVGDQVQVWYLGSSTWKGWVCWQNGKSLSLIAIDESLVL